jgi:hypothetical protein
MIRVPRRVTAVELNAKEELRVSGESPTTAIFLRRLCIFGHSPSAYTGW